MLLSFIPTLAYFGYYLFMATIIERPSESQNNSNTLLVLFMLLIFGFLFFYYGLPLLRSAVSGPRVSVPEQIDINVNQPEAPAGQ